MKALYVSWDGPEQNYMESLFLPLFARLQEEEQEGVRLEFSVLQYLWERNPCSTERLASSMGIGYRARSVPRRPLKAATAAAIIQGASDVVRAWEGQELDVVIPRSIIPAAMTLLAARRRPEMKILFDADGLMADERVDFTGWSPAGVTYRLFREFESQMVRRADAVITRTSRAREILLHRAGAGTDASKIFVVPNPKDEELFDPGTKKARALVRAERGISPDAPWLVYAGSLGPQYYPERMLDLFEKVLARRPDARLLVLTGQTARLEASVEARGLRESVTLDRVEAGAVPRLLAAADLGLALRQPSFSQQAVAPIKIAEYLMCGLPVVCTSGVGDVEEQLDEAVGLVLGSVGGAELDSVAEWFVGDVLEERQSYRRECRRRGIELFGMARCLSSYQRAFGYLREQPSS